MAKQIKPQMFGIWRRMTEWNHHSECLVSIAKAFGYKDLYEKLNEIKKQHYKIGYLPYDLWEKRNALYKELVQRIKEEEGEDMFNKVMASI